jgi:cell division protein FtsB
VIKEQMKIIEDLKETVDELKREVRELKDNDHSKCVQHPFAQGMV